MNNNENSKLNPQNVFDAALQSGIIDNDDLNGLSRPGNYLSNIEVISHALLVIVAQEEADLIPAQNTLFHFIKYLRFKEKIAKINLQPTI